MRRARNRPPRSIAGIVTDFKQLTTKGRKPYSRTMLEDYSGSYELALFGKDHEAFMQYMQPMPTSSWKAP